MAKEKREMKHPKISKTHKLKPTNRLKTKTKSKKIKTNNKELTNRLSVSNEINSTQLIPNGSVQMNFFLNQYQSANGIKLSSLELESFTDSCILKLSESPVQDASNLSEHMKTSFGPRWKEVLCKKQPSEDKSEHGSPALLTISLSALRSLELLRGLKPFTKECPAAKLFSKHLKIDEQVSFLKNHVNIACGTPSRIKKLIDMEALSLSRLAVVLLDMETDVKGYSLFTLPQVRDEFWDLYKTYFHQRLLLGELRICLYGTIPVNTSTKVEDS